MKCKNCGFLGKEDFAFCPKCGTKATVTSKKAIPAKSGAVHNQTTKNIAARSKTYWLLILLAIVAVAALGYFIVNQGKANELLLLVPRSTTKSDLVLVKVGDEIDKGVKLLKNYTTASKSFINNYDKFPLGSTVVSSQASFSANGRMVFAAYQDENDQYLDRIDIQSKTAKNLYQSNYTLNAYIQPNADEVLIKETRSATSCELLSSVKGEEAKRLLKGKTCNFSADGSTMIITKDTGSTAVTLSVAKVATPDKVVPILDQQKDILSYNLSSDGKLLYVNKGTLVGAKQVFLYDTASGEKLVESQPFIYQYATRFSTKGHGFFLITEDEKGILDLSVFDGNQLVSVKKGRSFHPAFNQDGTLLAYSVGQDKLSQTAYLYDLQTKTEVEVATGKSLSFAFIESPQRLLVRDNVINEVSLFSTDLKGANGVELFDKAGYALGTIFQPIGQNRLFILATKGTNMHLFTTSLDKADGFFLVEDFKSITPHTVSPDGKWLIFSGLETISTATNLQHPLYRVEVVKDGTVDKLETEGIGYTNAVFTPEGKTLLYTMKTSTDRLDTMVKSIEMKDDAKPQELYDQAIIQDIRWGRLYPWQRVTWTTQTINGMTTCTDARDLAATASRIESNITAGQDDCFKLSLTNNEPISFTASNSFGAVISMSIIDRTGISYATSKSALAAGTNEPISSLVLFPTKTGVFYLKVTSLKSTPYMLDVAVRRNSFSNARTIQPSQTIETSLGQEDYFIDRNNNLVAIQGYGQAFLFNGSAGQKVTVEVAAKIADPNLKPTLVLYNSIKKSLVSGIFTEEKNGSLTYTLPSTARYYILFLSVNPRFGINLAQNYTYQLSLKIS